MNLEEMTKRFGLSSVERMKSYMEKAENSETSFCAEHDREFFDFEFEGKCPICFEDLWFKAEHGDEQAREILERSARLED
jgi:hypothetical protein